MSPDIDSQRRKSFFLFLFILFILAAFRDGGRHLKATDKVLTNQPPSIVVMQFDQRLYVALLSVSAVHEFP